MDKIKIKVSTIARIAALLVAIINQVLAIFGKDILPFTENWVYQLVSLVATIVIAIINCWYNQDVTVPARIAGKLFESLRDGNLTDAEMESIVEFAESDEAKNPGEGGISFLIGFANGILKTIQEPKDKKKKTESAELLPDKTE